MRLMISALNSATQTTQTTQNNKLSSLSSRDELLEALGKIREKQWEGVPDKVKQEYKECQDTIRAIEAKYKERFDCQGFDGYNSFGDPRYSFSANKMLEHCSPWEKQTYLDCYNKLQEIYKKYPQVKPLITLSNYKPEKDTAVGEQQAAATPAQPPAQETPDKKGISKVDKAIIRGVGGVAGWVATSGTPDNDEGGSKIVKGIAKSALGIIGLFV